MTDQKMLPVAAPIIGEREVAYVTDAVRSGWVSSIGPYIDRFEEAFARFVGVQHAIAVSNGTVALHLALHALGLGPGDEVIVPDLTFAATAHTVLQTGAVPVFADVEPDTWCIDPRAVERAISPRTRAIIPVHLYGHPADMKALSELARTHDLHVIEDAAEAHGAKVGDVMVGALGKAATFSFYGNKIMTTGEGGMVTTDDTAFARRCRSLKDHGMSPERRYFHTELAFNYRMTNLQAALGVAQIEQIDALIAHKCRIMAGYRAALAGLIGRDAPPHRRVQLNEERPSYRNVYWMVSAVLSDDIALDRAEVCARLRARGIDTRPFFVPMSGLPHLAAYRAVGATGAGCPVSERLSRRGFNLPSGCGLSDAEVQRAAQALIEVLRG
jgi:perosamine synthetase